MSETSINPMVSRRTERLLLLSNSSIVQAQPYAPDPSEDKWGRSIWRNSDWAKFKEEYGNPYSDENNPPEPEEVEVEDSSDEERLERLPGESNYQLLVWKIEEAVGNAEPDAGRVAGRGEGRVAGSVAGRGAGRGGRAPAPPQQSRQLQIIEGLASDDDDDDDDYGETKAAESDDENVETVAAAPIAPATGPAQLTPPPLPPAQAQLLPPPLPPAQAQLPPGDDGSGAGGPLAPLCFSPTPAGVERALGFSQSRAASGRVSAMVSQERL